MALDKHLFFILPDTFKSSMPTTKYGHGSSNSITSPFSSSHFKTEKQVAS